MKRSVMILLSLLLVCTLLLGSDGSVIAAVGDDPTVTPVSGDTDFITEVVPIAHLPGTTELASQMLVPVGFPLGEAQFGGNGIRVSKMDSGKATACFTLNTVAVQQGWGGKVGVWNGAKWVLLPTTITTTSDEAAATTACAPITGNGTYTFIQYVVDAELLPKEKPLCEEILGEEIFWWGVILNYDPYTFSGPIGNVLPLPWPGVTITWQVIDSNYPMIGDVSGSQVIDGDGYFDFGSASFTWTGPDTEYPIFTIRLDTPFCYQLDPQFIGD